MRSDGTVKVLDFGLAKIVEGAYGASRCLGCLRCGRPGAGTAEVFVEPLSGGGAKYQLPTLSGHHSMWWRDGSELFYSPGVGPLESVRVVTGSGLTFLTPRTLPLIQATNADTPRQLDISPDGSMFAAIAVRGSLHGDSRFTSETRVVINWLTEMKARLAASR